ncbi:MAG: hypothetical protein P8106_04805 [Gammaproteobacteria bacterium]
MSHGVAQSLAHLDKQRVADVVPARVVQQLEVVEVEHQNRAVLAAGRRSRHGGLDAVAQQPTVGKTGQWVEQSKLADVVFRHLALGDVRDIAVPQRTAVGQGLGGGVALDPDDTLDGVADAELAVPGALLVRRGVDLGHDPLAVVRVNLGQHARGVHLHLLRRDPKHIHHALAGVRATGRAVRPQVVLVDEAGNVLRQLVEAGGQLPALGNVLHHAGNRDHAAPRVAAGQGFLEHQTLAGVGPDDAKLRARVAAVRTRRLQRIAHPWAIVTVDQAQRATHPRGERGLVDAVDAVDLVGPGHLIGLEVPLPVADVRQLLRGDELLARLRDFGDLLLQRANGVANTPLQWVEDQPGLDHQR